MFTAFENKLITALDARFPAHTIREKFNLFTALDPDLCLDQATNIVKIMPRSGWVRIGVPEESRQSVHEHEESCGHLMPLMTGRHFHFIEGVQHAVNMVLHHDKPGEAIPGDFTPNDKITKEEKALIEDLSARVILASHPDIYKRWREFEENKTLAARLSHDTDQLEMVTRALYIEERHPKMHDALTPFWKSAASRLQTSMAKKEYQALSNMRDGRSSTPLYEDMRAHYAAQKMGL